MLVPTGRGKTTRGSVVNGGNKKKEKETGEKRQRPPSHSNCEKLEVDSPLYIIPHLCAATGPVLFSGRSSNIIISRKHPLALLAATQKGRKPKKKRKKKLIIKKNKKGRRINFLESARSRSHVFKVLFLLEGGSAVRIFRARLLGDVDIERRTLSERGKKEEERKRQNLIINRTADRVKESVTRERECVTDHLIRVVVGEETPERTHTHTKLVQELYIYL